MNERLPDVRTPKFLYSNHVFVPKSGVKRESHAHPMYELIYFIRGDASHVVEDRRYKLSRGDLVIVRPGKFHDICFDSDREYERCNILFDMEAMGLWRAEEVSQRFEVVSLAEHPEISAVFAKLTQYREVMTEEDFVEAAAHLLFQLFCDLSLLPEQKERTYSVHPLLSRALAYIRDNLFTVRDVAEVAGALYVTESYLFRLFRRELKTGPKRYITEKRLLAARSLIRLGRRPSDVYLECGFSDYTAFFRNYKSFFGYSPSKE